MAKFERISIDSRNVRDDYINKVVAHLRAGAVIIYPTDTVYGIGCDITNKKSVARLCRIKGVKVEKLNLSFICSDLSHVSEFAKNISTPVFKMMKKVLPGPYTFLLPATSSVPRMFSSNKRSVGIRIPDNDIALKLVNELGNPLISSSLKRFGQEEESYITEPNQIEEEFGNLVDVFVDSGPGGRIPSTVIDCRFPGDPTLVREGLGNPEFALS